MFRHLALICFCIILISSCKENNSGKLTSQTLRDKSPKIDTTYYANGAIEQILQLDKPNGKLNGRCESYYPSGALRTIKYFYDDTAKGNSFYYYPNGKLQKFEYLINNDFNTYTKEYDSTGRILKEIGTPFVSYHLIQGLNDTLRIQLFISNYGYKNILYEISPDGRKYTTMELRNSNIEGTQVAKVWKLFAGLKNISVFMKITCTDSLLKTKTYFDTVSLDRK